MQKSGFESQITCVEVGRLVGDLLSVDSAVCALVVAHLVVLGSRPSDDFCQNY